MNARTESHGAAARALVVTCILGVAGFATAQPVPPLPAPPVPPQNPITEAKRVLGKILFWDAQLSSDNTVACGTCHIPGVAGGDPRIAVNPGNDGVTGTPDDVTGSLGMIRTASTGEYTPDPVFGLNFQVTPRAANPPLMAAYFQSLFWDGRAPGAFTDPQTGQVVIPVGGALESQAIAPIVSDVEMGHEDRDWDQVAEKLAAARPMALASNLPQDMASAIEVDPSYPELFQAAFGDPAITAARIAFAIATYERTLVPNQTPWDAFNAGNLNAMTPQQVQGWNIFRSGTPTQPGARCALCHIPPVFLSQVFHNIGLRPWQEDPGLMETTGNFADRGKFKTASLRNVGLKETFMHNGRLTSLNQVLDFYLEINGQQQFPENQDPLIAGIAIAPNQRLPLIDFLSNALTDPRVANEQFPFDRPTLHSEVAPPNPMIVGGGTPGSGGLVPIMIAVVPPNIGNGAFKIGITRALGAAQAWVALSSAPPGPDGILVPDMLLGPITLTGTDAGEGFGTFFWPIPDQISLLDESRYLQWMVADPGAAGGMAFSPVARLTFFCNNGCNTCPTDLDADGDHDSIDLNVLLSDFGCDGGNAGFCPGDVDGDSDTDSTDLNMLLSAFGQPCE